MKTRLLIISHVLPFPGQSGQQMRVRNKLLAFKPDFEITFLTFAQPAQIESTRESLVPYVDHSIVMPARSSHRLLARLMRAVYGEAYVLATGLKPSNLFIGERELSPRRIAAHCTPTDYDIVLFEYWHAHRSLEVFQRHGIPCVLDMHDLLWQSWDRQLSTHPLPWRRLLRGRLVDAYRRHEEAAWQQFDILIAISEGEAEVVRQVVHDKPVILAPMGIDLGKWAYNWIPAEPPRLGFYGSLGGSRFNQESVMRCVKAIMPRVWAECPDSEFWIVGANPPPEIKALEADSRIHVTGFVSDVAEVLKTMTAVLCPWTGTYGFRSRIIEVMALGVPVIATPDAVYGMGMDERGLFLGETDKDMVACGLKLLQKPQVAMKLSRLARQQIEDKFGFEATYGHLARVLHGACIEGQSVTSRCV
ncbi:MAG: glycosyltransferase family 4 protein [Anaerolineae bacterium]|nr:glycosyltransferase family 4 protein [Anaerolineae bacterium]